MTKIVAYDWAENPIYSDDGENYFNTDDGFVFDDFMAQDIRDYMTYLWGPSRPIYDWLESERNYDK